MEEPIVIIPYQPRWPGEFQSIAQALADALGPLALRIEHIGSTSVPGLASKDLIDIQLSVSAFSPELVAAMEAAGWVYKPGNTRDDTPLRFTGDAAEWEKRFFSPPAGHRPVNLHVRIPGRANHRYALLFRDYLRAHPAAAAIYADLKRRLAAHYGTQRQVYVDLKEPACDLIMLAAEDWASAVGWQE